MAVALHEANNEQVVPSNSSGSSNNHAAYQYAAVTTDAKRSESAVDRFQTPTGGVSNVIVLNFAFGSFLGFTALQFVFAYLAHSHAMMADCSAMSVDVGSYLINAWAEKLKHGRTFQTRRHYELHRLSLELIPPLISLVTLLVVTILAMKQAIQALVLEYHVHHRGPHQVSTEKNEAGGDIPTLWIMLSFSAMNLLLDVLNVSCFAQADQAVGLPGQHGQESIHIHYLHAHQHRRTSTTDARGNRKDSWPTEKTSLLVNDEEEDNQSSSLDLERRPQEEDCLSEESESVHDGLNLNMCSAWTHVCADTLRSVAVLAAAACAAVWPSRISPVVADSWATVIVSVIILASLAPLVQGLCRTVRAMYEVWRTRVVELGNDDDSIDASLSIAV